MILLLKQCRVPTGWYEVMVSEKTAELISRLNEIDEGKKRSPSKLYELVKLICHHPEHPNELLAAFDDDYLIIFIKGVGDALFLVEFENAEKENEDENKKETDPETSSG